jgi:cation diffusion facilitator CzcD-associated flavoprotein CzcO
MTSDHVDVLIVGAGISGIDAACRLRERCPGRTFAILEARGEIGGTWDLFRFPGIRSDSDMYTLSFPFRPWRGSQAIVGGGEIRDYVRDTAREYGIDRAIRFHHRVVAAEWSGPEARWHVEAERIDTGETVRLTCGFLFGCTGYYRYEAGYAPEFPGTERFRGAIVHPQTWPDDVDYAGKRVVVIGSGATAVTLVPALAGRAAHVTMLQRSPSYVISLPAVDPLARVVRRVLPDQAAYRVLRAKNSLLAILIWIFSKRRPQAMRRLIRRLAQRQLPPGFDVDTHFNPRYDPWDERMCIIPDNDLFAAISSGGVSVVTDRVETFTETGIRLASGAELEADLVVTATGLKLQPLGGMRLAVDGRAVDLADTFAYRGMQVSGVPNLAFAFGYINQSWTLGADLTALQLCRLLNHMQRHGYTTVTPRHPGDGEAGLPFAELSSGYIVRDIGAFPKQAAAEPWRREQNYAQNRRVVLRSPLDDPALEFARAPIPVAA